MPFDITASITASWSSPPWILVFMSLLCLSSEWARHRRFPGHCSSCCVCAAVLMQNRRRAFLVQDLDAAPSAIEPNLITPGPC